MIITKIWNMQRGFLSEWYGRNTLGHYVAVRCKRGVIELRCHDQHLPGMRDLFDLVVFEDYDPQVGPTYRQIKDALTVRGHVFPESDSWPREDLPERPPFPGYRGPGTYRANWRTGGCDKIEESTP